MRVRRLGVLCAALAVFWWLALAVGLSVPVEALRQPLQAAVQTALGEQAEIKGGVAVKPTLGPSVILRDLRISGGAGLLRVERVEARLGLLSLLRGEPVIVRLSMQGVRLELDTRGGGLRTVAETAIGSVGRLQVQHGLEMLVLHELLLSWHDPQTGRILRLDLDEFSVALPPGRPLAIQGLGRYRGRPLAVRIDAPPLQDLLAGARAWHWYGQLQYAHARLKLDAKLEIPQRGAAPALDFVLRGSGLPLLQSSRFQGRIDLTDDGARLAELTGSLAGTQLTGSGLLTLDGQRPRLQLDLTVPVLDAGELAGPLQRNGFSMAGLPAPGDTATLSPWLQLMDIDAGIVVHSLAHAFLPVHDARLKLQVRAGKVAVPVGMTVAGIGLRGNLMREMLAAGPAVRLALRATNAAVADVAAALPGVSGMRGRIGEIELHAVAVAAGEGDSLTAELRLADTELILGGPPGRQPVTAFLDKLTLRVPASGAVGASLQGRLLKQPVEMLLSGPGLGPLLQGGQWPFRLSATGAGARLGVQGEVVSARGRSQARLNLELSGRRLGELAPWLGVSPCAMAAYNARAQLILSDDIGRLQFVQARLGETRLNAELDWTRDETIPLLHVLAQFDKLVPDDLAGALQFVTLAGPAADTAGLRLDIPVLPRIVQLQNADLRLLVEELALGPVAVSNLDLEGSIRAARLQRSPFEMLVGGTRVEGYLDPAQGDTGVVVSVGKIGGQAGGLIERLFSQALRWVGETGSIPLRNLVRRMLDAGEGEDCAPPQAEID